MSAFKLAHLSDLHLGPLPPTRWRDLLSKRIIGYVNWQRNRLGRFRQDILETLVQDLRALEPDHIVVSGDLCNISLAAEFTSAGQWLETLGDPRDVTVVPGNHDAYVASGRRRAWAAWAPFMTGDGGEVAGLEVAFPFVRRREDVVLIGLSTSVASPPTFATGRLGRTQLMRLEALLGELPDDVCRIVVLHHPPSRELTSFRRRLTDDSGLRRLVRRYRVDLILCGHEHRLKMGTLEGPHGLVPVVVAPAASLDDSDPRQEGGYLVYTLERAPSGWVIAWSLRRFSAKANAFAEVRNGYLSDPKTGAALPIRQGNRAEPGT